MEITVDGVKVTYHVAGSGPVCLVHSGGPGIHYDYLRMPELEKHLTMVYVEPVGTGNSGLLPDGDYSVARYAYFANQVAQHADIEPLDKGLGGSERHMWPAHEKSPHG